MTYINQNGRSRIPTALVLISVMGALTKSTIAFVPAPIKQQSIQSSSIPIRSYSTTTTTALEMSLADVSAFYADFPLQAAVLTCGFKASVADGIAQVKSHHTTHVDDNNNDNNKVSPSSSSSLSELVKTIDDNIEFKRNLAYIIYGGIFIGALCHYEYDVIFPILFGTEHSLVTSIQEVLFDNFITAPIAWLPPAYFIKAVMYDYPMREGLERYIHDVTKNDLLRKYWTVWVPAQSVSFTVVPDHFRVVFMASVSFFWFIMLSTISSSSDEQTK